MNNGQHWESIYRSQAPAAVSWYRPHLDTSLALIEQLTSQRNDAIAALYAMGTTACPMRLLDIGGASTLAGDLLPHPSIEVTVLDIAPAALAQARKQLGSAAKRICWITADFLTADLEDCSFAICHDRAVFHFLQQPEERAAYVRQAARILPPGGHLILATFGPQGPERCSGLPVRRYNATMIEQQFSPDFTLLDTAVEIHGTPSGTQQQFFYALLERSSPSETAMLLSPDLPCVPI